MKKIETLLLLVFALVLKASAQTPQLSTEMNAFYKYCLDIRKSVQSQSMSALEKCIVDWDGEGMLKYNGVEIELDTHSDVVGVDTFGLTDIKGHLQFSPVFIDSLISYGVRLEHFPKIEESMKDYAPTPDLVRGGVYDCLFSHVCIKAGKQVSLFFSASGDCELFIISENGAKITASVTLGDMKESFLKETSDAPCFKWNMIEGKYVLSISNPTDKDISVIIATN